MENETNGKVFEVSKMVDLISNFKILKLKFFFGAANFTWKTNTVKSKVKWVYTVQEQIINIRPLDNERSKTEIVIKSI